MACNGRLRPSTSDKPLIRVNASWMELFTLYADDEGIRARFPVHLSDFTTDHAPAQGHVDESFLEHCVRTPEDVGYFFPRGKDIFGINVRGSASIGKFLATRRVLRAIRAFNLTQSASPHRSASRPDLRHQFGDSASGTSCASLVSE